MFKSISQAIKMHSNLNKLIETVQLLTHQTLFIEICIDYDPTRFLPQFVGDLLDILLLVVFCAPNLNV